MVNMKWTLLLFCLACHSTNDSSSASNADNDRPNIIFMMADDLGWGDVGFNGNAWVKTPALDQMAREGIVFSRFYAAAPVCSPTRGSCLTGRHPFRYGVFFANRGKMEPEELTMAEYLQGKGYRTGHFGKWHLGTLTNDENDANRGGRDSAHYAPPWENGFDICFSTESKVPTWNPMITPDADAGDVGKNKPGTPFGTFYWNEKGKKINDNLEGDDSRVIMDRVIPFIEDQVSNEAPFFAVVWFHTPHLPVLTGEKYRNLYKGQSTDLQHYYGAISAMDEQICRLNARLKELNIDKNTLVFFTSDNGPEGKTRANRTQGSTGGFRGRKRSLYEGGIRVPGIAVWPAKIKGGRQTDYPAVTSDYFPTVLDILGERNQFPVRPIDGISLMEALNGDTQVRPVPIGFQSEEQKAWIDNQYKLFVRNGQPPELYDLLNDPFETKDISGEHPDQLKKMEKLISDFVNSCTASERGADYN
ncbi:Arylsulfatase A [Parapedobacter indicus]|uniref:Arylsulfatase A n=2 Tax=Parapedobacter indicus TaxID=1477437 RepID=A0A1I3PRQ7_9SPHI|nr:arylsulfatase A-like enzyme [Parapedobacter indicus]SFJ24179.1 Arylsulfatase A [Parapedobacter indicus]